MKKAVFISLFAILGCVADPNNIEATVEPYRLSASDLNIAKSAVAEESREPEAVRFRNFSGYKTSAGDTIVCAEVNAKNAYGGYAGYRPMCVRFNGKKVKSTIWEEETAAGVLEQCAAARAGRTMVSS
jgi:hypothetical protein